MTSVDVTTTEARKVKERGVPAEKLIPLMACCCEHWSLYCEFPDCCGIDCTGVCICCDARGSCKLIMPTTCCKGINQCCCCDGRCALPCDDEVPFWIACLGMTCAGGPIKAGTATTVAVNNGTPGQQVDSVAVSTTENRKVTEKGVPAEDLIPLMACCCEHLSLYCKFPECLGYDCTGTCCCCEGRESCKCIVPTTCCKGICQYFCCDTRCACPCDDEVPFWIACLGMTCAGGPTKRGTSTDVVVNTSASPPPPQMGSMDQASGMADTVNYPQPDAPPGAVYMKNGVWLDADSQPVKT